MQAHRLRAPATDGALAGRAAARPRPRRCSSRNADRLGAWDYDFQGRGRSALRTHGPRRGRRHRPATTTRRPASTCRRSRPSPARSSSTGHQPELFHPGVWVKNFAVAGLAAKAGGLGLNLIVDNDIPKGAVDPRPRAAMAGRRTMRPVRLRRLGGGGPLRRPADPRRGALRHVRRVASTRRSDGLVADPLARRVLAHVMAAPEDMPGRDRVGRRFARPAASDRGRAGASTTSKCPWASSARPRRSSGSPATCWRSSRGSRRSTTRALARYRALYKIRSKNHPVPALGREGDWLEAPFWVWRAGRAQAPAAAGPPAREDDASCGSPARTSRSWRSRSPPTARRVAPSRRLRELPGRGIRLRTRALTTTMFARLLPGRPLRPRDRRREVRRARRRDRPRLLRARAAGLPDALDDPLARPADDPGPRREAAHRASSADPRPDLATRALPGRATAPKDLDRRRSVAAHRRRAGNSRRSGWRGSATCGRLNDALAARIDESAPGAVGRGDGAGSPAAIQDDAVARSREYAIVLFDERRIEPAMTAIAREAAR